MHVAEPLAVSIDRLPTLTEVLELGRDFQALAPTHALPALHEVADAPPVVNLALSLPVPLPLPVPVELPVPLPQTLAPPRLDEEALVARVLGELEPRVAALLEGRVSEALAPALARAADTLIRESRLELASALRALVQESLAQALRHRDDHELG